LPSLTFGELRRSKGGKMFSNPEKLVLLKASLNSLRSLNHSPETSSCLIGRIIEAVEAEEVSWDDLGTNPEELNFLEKEIAHKSKAREFVDGWQAFQQGKLPPQDLQRQIADVEFLLVRGLIGFEDISPCTMNELTKLKMQLKKQAQE